MMVAAVVSIAIYVGAVRSQNGLPAWWFFALMVAMAVAVAVSAALREKRIWRVLVLPATVLAAGLGLLAFFSIGGSLLITAALGGLALAIDSR